MQQAEIEEGHRPGVTTEQARRIAEPEGENRELRRATEFLRTASAIRLGGARPPPEVIVAYIDEHREGLGVAAS